MPKSALCNLRMVQGAATMSRVCTVQCRVGVRECFNFHAEFALGIKTGIRLLMVPHMLAKNDSCADESIREKKRLPPVV